MIELGKYLVKSTAALGEFETPTIPESTAALQLLGNVFFSKDKCARFLEEEKERLSRRIEELIKSDGSETRGSDLYAIYENSVLVGSALIHFYPWEILAPQLHFVVHERRVSLAQLHTLVKNDGEAIQLAGELAYYTVVPSYRGLGLGKVLFELFLGWASATLTESDLVFTIAKGLVGNATKGAILQKYLLDKERKAAGVGPGEFVPIAGVEISLDEALVFTGLGETELTVDPSAAATYHLAEKFGFRLLGMSKSLGFLYGSTAGDYNL